MHREPIIAELYDKDLYRNQALPISVENLKVDYLSAEKTTITILSLNNTLLQKLSDTARYTTIRNMYSGDILYSGVASEIYKDGSHYSMDILPILSAFDADFGCGFGPAAAKKASGIGTTCGDQLIFAMAGLYGGTSRYPTMQTYIFAPYKYYVEGTTQINTMYVNDFKSKNVFESIGDMLKLYKLFCGVTIKASSYGPDPDGTIDITAKQAQNTKPKWIDTRLSNVLNIEIDDGTKSSVNVLYLANEDTYPDSGSVKAYIRYDNGAIAILSGGTNNASRINPQMEIVSAEDWANGDEIARGKLTLANYDVTVRVTLRKADTLTPLSAFELGDTVYIITDVWTKTLQLTAYEVKGEQVTYTFGNGRQTLTQKIREERTK